MELNSDFEEVTTKIVNQLRKVALDKSEAYGIDYHLAYQLMLFGCIISNGNHIADGISCEKLYCYECDKPVNYLFDDGRCRRCTRMTEVEIRRVVEDSVW